MYKYYISMIVLLIIITLPTVSAVEWTNITCVNGNAEKMFNSTINGEDINRSETEICGDLNCVNSIGCVDPRNTPGEVFLGAIILFLGGSFLFGYLSMKINAKKYTPIRLLFFMVMLILIIAGALMSSQVALTFYHTEISSTISYAVYGLLIVFLFMLAFFIVEFVKWVTRNLKNAKKGNIDGDVFDPPR